MKHHILGTETINQDTVVPLAVTDEPRFHVDEESEEPQTKHPRLDDDLLVSENDTVVFVNVWKLSYPKGADPILISNIYLREMTDLEKDRNSINLQPIWMNS